MVPPTKALTRELLPCLNSPTTTMWMPGSASRCFAVRSRVARSGRWYASQAWIPRSTTAPAFVTAPGAGRWVAMDISSSVGSDRGEQQRAPVDRSCGQGARWQRCGWPGSGRGLGVVVAFALDLDVLVGVLVAVALLGADLGLVGVDVGLLRVLAVVAVGLAVADVDGRAVVHVVVGGVVGVAFQADRGVGDVGVTEVGHVALTEVLHRVLRVDVIALDAGELAGVGRAVDVAGGLQVTVAGGDRAVDLAGVLHRLVTGVGLRHPEVVAVDDLP